MRKSVLLFLLASAFGFHSFAQATKSITLEDIWTRGTFSSRFVAGFNSMNDGRYYCGLDEKRNLLRYEFSSGNLVDTLLSVAKLREANGGQSLDFDNYSFSTDEKSLLLSTQTESIYRHSSKSVYYVYRLQEGKLIKPIEAKVRYADFSPDASKLAYVKDNNLFVFDLARMQEIQVTTDGKENAIINGGTDWVYEEEFAIWKGFQWNATGDKIAFYRFDESKVKQFNFAVYGSLYPQNTEFKYPKAGEDNSLVGLYVYELKTNQVVEVETGKETDQYLPRFSWTRNANTLAVQRLNRLQNKLEILLADASTGSSKVVWTEENKAYVEVGDDLFFLPDGKSFLISSERDGFKHLYQFGMNGKLIRQLTKGNFDLDEIYGFDEKNKRIYFSAAMRHPAEREVYWVDLKGKKPVCITPKKGWNSASFNSDFTYFLHSWSALNQPYVFSLCKADGNVVRVLEDNASLAAKLPEYGVSPGFFLNMKNSKGMDLSSWVIRPADFDSSKKYPVLMYVYGGPGSQTVMNRWSGGNYLWFQLLAQKGFVVISVDGRGTGFKGEAFKKCTYLNLGGLEIEDQIDIARQLKNQKWVDANRISIWGWSFGGYMSSLGISKGADVFSKAIAVAPVTNWRYYDNIYTERYMRKPQENGANYDSNSPINHVDKISGKYLLIHGTADDNVHFQNAVEMVDAMIKKGVKYDSEFYPNKNHGIGGGKTRLHLYERMTRFLLD
ncbi:MAG: S9 family peptidase [Bacteroidia bacterium]|nr:S9 family peptidase [Bacteroidia bacterium]